MASTVSPSPRSSSSSGQDRPDDSSFLSSEAGDQTVLRHPKGKRKRTAAKDKAILEAAYLANPKPDKTARLDIVDQVSLNEKEVQIWFQNRRQNDRRKSRPLTHQEIAALRYGGMHVLSDPPPFVHASLSQHSSFSDGGSGTSSPHVLHTFSSASMAPAAPAPSNTPLSSPELGPWMPDALARKQTEEKQLQQQQSEHEDIRTPSAPHSLSSISSVGYLANRWNMHSSFSTPSSLSESFNHPSGQDSVTRGDALRQEPFVSPASASASIGGTTVAAATAESAMPSPISHQQRQLPPLQTQTKLLGQQRPFRLSLSLDGKAEVIASQSPSPPRLPLLQSTFPLGRRTDGNSHQSDSSTSDSESHLASLPAIRRPSLSRSHSALPSLGLTLPPISNLTGSLTSSAPALPRSTQQLVPPTQPKHNPTAHPPFPPRLLRHRSRDVHVWESVCDSESRVDDELSVHAQQEASGSAIAAISLIRSTSGTSSSLAAMLQPNAAKRNKVFARSAAPRPGNKRGKLGRASSSVARMQSTPLHNYHNAEREDKENKRDNIHVADDDKKKFKRSTLQSGNDSDKENWSPDEEGRPVQRASVNGRRPLPVVSIGATKGATAALVQSKVNASALATRQVGRKGAAPDSLDIYEDPSSSPSAHGDNINADTPRKRIQLRHAATVSAADEVARFMRGDEVSPSKKGDLDCVAGLLSLSQGNWR